MPSTTSSVVSIDFASSTVIVPSLPTLSMASAMISPIVRSQLAETVATCAISVRSLTFFEIFDNSATTASTALLMPRCSDVGSLGSDFTNELGAHVFVRILELDFLGHGHTILGDRRAAEFLVEDDVA